MSKKKSPDINEIIANKWLVHYNRKPLDKHLLYGFVLACNDEFTLLQIFDNSLFTLDGFCVFRNKDVKSYAVYDDENYFLSEVIKYEAIAPQTQPTISIESWAEILRTVNESFPLIVVERESIERDVCYIGKLIEIKKKSFVLDDIDPDAEWDGKRSYKFNDLTMIKFGGRYETVLASVNENRESKKIKN